METFVLIVTLAAVTFLIGILLGFIGAGGAALIVAILSTGFDLPIHQAIGTALAAMVATGVFGAWSHLREGNVAPRAGLIVGAASVVGAIGGALLGQRIPEVTLTIAAALGLWALGTMIWLRTRFAQRLVAGTGQLTGDIAPGRRVPSAMVGVVGGGLSALLGVGMSSFIQLGLLAIGRLSLRQSVGTAMMVLVFMSVGGALTFLVEGNVAIPYLIGTVIGLSSGSFIGARFTARAPLIVLRTALIATPVFAGFLLLGGLAV